MGLRLADDRLKSGRVYVQVCERLRALERYPAALGWPLHPCVAPMSHVHVHVQRRLRVCVRAGAPAGERRRAGCAEPRTAVTRARRRAAHCQRCAARG
eukprot:scaffold62186_cov76-Phaeocystis_antarctica.AAC.5